MRTWMIGAALLLAGCATPGASAPPSAVAASPALQESSIQAAVEAAIGGEATGTVLVARGGRILHADGLGDPTNGVPKPSRGSVYDVASIGKTMTAIALQRLAEQGKVDLQAPIRRYIPELPEALEDITVQHALDNNSGWTSYLDGEDFTPRTAEQLPAGLAKVERKGKAGSGYSYSNAGFAALGLVVQRASGKPFEEALRELVFRPARMNSTGFFSEPRWRKADVAQGYVKGKPTGSAATFPHTWSLLGAAGVATTVDDLYRANRTFLAGSALGAGRARMLAPGATTRKPNGRQSGPYLTPDTLNVSYGSGLFHWTDRQGRKVHFHGGDGDWGFHAFMWWREDDDLAVIALFNSKSEGFERGAFIDAVTAAVEADGATAAARP